MRDLSGQELGLIALFFAGEDETFPVFLEWGRQQAVSEEFVMWVNTIKVDEFREIILDYWRELRARAGSESKLYDVPSPPVQP
jgi:hypothetical protein